MRDGFTAISFFYIFSKFILYFNRKFWLVKATNIKVFVSLRMVLDSKSICTQVNPTNSDRLMPDVAKSLNMS